MSFVHLRNVHHGRTAGGRDVQGLLRWGRGRRGKLEADSADGDMENVPCWAESRTDSNAPRVTTVPNAMPSFSGQCYQVSPEISPVWRDHLKR